MQFYCVSPYFWFIWFRLQFGLNFYSLFSFILLLDSQFPCSILRTYVVDVLSFYYFFGLLVSIYFVAEHQK